MEKLALLLLFRGSRKKERKKREEKKRKNIRDPNAWISFYSPVSRSDRVISCSGWQSRARRGIRILLSTRELSEESPYQICIERTSEPRRKIDISGGNESEVETYPLPVHSNSRREKGSNLNFIYFLI